jgi:surface antigen
LTSPTPPSDGHVDPQGEQGFDWLLGTTASSSSDALPSRRDLRASAKPASRKDARAAAAASAKKPRRIRHTPAADVSAAAASSTGPRTAKLSRSAVRAAKRASKSVVARSDSAYPSERVLVVVRPTAKRKHKRGSGILAVGAVALLFGTVAMPAFAFGTQDADSLSAVTTASDEAALTVSDGAAAASTLRSQFTATSVTDLRSQRSSKLKSANYEAYLKSGARELGDDYPWFSELYVGQGGSLSPLNYFYRECVDFVAWRLNRDAGSTSAPFKYDWSYLTPSGGNASQWKYAWKQHGWETSNTPVVGSVAWWAANHVAYVKAVNPDGTVLLEEYNYGSNHLYGQRTIPASEVDLFLYPPPR